MHIFNTPESFTKSLSERYEPNKNDENVANIAVPEKLVVQQQLPPINSLVIGGSIEFKLSTKPYKSLELIGHLVISHGEH